MPERRSRAGIRVREVMHPDDPAFRRAHAMLRRSFHRAEMLPLHEWQNAMRERSEDLWTDVAWHLVVAERDGDLLGAATGSYLGNVNVGIVGYVAVAPAGRSLGLGPRLRRGLVRRLDADARRMGHEALAAMIGEVRADNPWLQRLVRQDGAIALDFPYFQPSLGGDREPVELVLYYQPLVEARTSLPVAELRKLLYTLWRRAYRVARPLGHAEFRAMLRSLEGRRRIGQRTWR